jgi:hypothetical protein
MFRAELANICVKKEITDLNKKKDARKHALDQSHKMLTNDQTNLLKFVEQDDA